jgi:hypothetical protein
MPEAPGTDSGPRAKDICRALGTTANHTESLSAKLKSNSTVYPRRCS